MRTPTSTAGAEAEPVGVEGGHDGAVPKVRDDTAVPDRPEVLCERVRFFPDVIGSLAMSFSWELAPGQGKKPSQFSAYGVSSVVIPPGGWKITAIAIYTVYPSNPEGWLKVRRARLNVFPKSGALPTAAQDPRRGREVPVTVRKLPGKVKDEFRPVDIYEVRASDLDLTLQAGEHWIGLTPIVTDDVGTATHLSARDVHDARSDDAHREFNAGEPTAPKGWTAEGPGSRLPQAHLSLRIEGRRIARGRLLDWSAEASPQAKRLYLRFGTFDPLADPPKIPKDLTAPGDAKLWIVQHRHAVDQQARDRLAHAGATLRCYLPDDAYVVQLDPAAVQKVRELPGVRWIGPYHPAYRLDANVFPEAGPFYGDPLWREEPEGVRHVLIYPFGRDDAAHKLVAKAVQVAGGKVRFQSSCGTYLAADVPRNRLAQVARCDAVCAIERRYKGSGAQQASAPDEKGVLTLTQVKELCGVQGVASAGGYEGLGVRAAFWDNGVRDDHVDLLARPLTVLHPSRYARVSHGTPIAGILCGEGRGDKRCRGLLPLGGLVFAENWGNPLRDDPYAQAEQFVRDHHAVVLSCSQGMWAQLQRVKHYDGYALVLDDLVSEYDLLVCEAFGNVTGSGNGISGSWAKNALVVGGVASRGSLLRAEHRPMFGCGPAPDGRVKPDLVHFSSGVLCADAASRRSYGRFGGTSCATPLVAGHAGLLMEMWADGAFGNLPAGRTVSDRRPHAVTARALLINSAYRYPIEGNKPRFTRYQQGWGMPDLGRLWESRKRLFVVDQEISLSDRQAVEYRLRVPEGAGELRATLAWTDPPGTISAAKALVNDLDLVVVAPDGRRYLGNQSLQQGNFSKEGGTPDRVNNVENVLLRRPAVGVWRVVVATHRVAWGRHGGADPSRQDFALVVAGVEPNPVTTEPKSR